MDLPFSWANHSERSRWFDSYVKGTPFSPSNSTPSSPTSPLSNNNNNSNNSQLNGNQPPCPSDIIDRTTFVNFVAKYGVPDDKRQLRSLAWKLLFRYIPFKRTNWNSAVTHQRQQYGLWVKEFVVNPYADMEKYKNEKREKGEPEEDEQEQQQQQPLKKDVAPKQGKAVDQWILVDPDEDPLAAMMGGFGPTKGKSNKQEIEPQFFQKPVDVNSSPSSTTTTLQSKAKSHQHSNRWQQYYLDEDIRLEIDKDIQRTYSTLHFFQKPVHPDDEEEYYATRSPISSSPFASSPNGDSDLIITDNGNNTEKSLKADLLGLKEDKKSKAQLNHGDGPGLFDDSMGVDETDIKYSDVSNQVDETTALTTSLNARKRPFRHQDALSRILFLYARLNPGVRYVQGMNEILAPIYHVFASDPDHLTTNKGRSMKSKQNPLPGDELLQEFSDAEADAFFVFTALMSEIRDRYIKSLDSSEHGILSIVARFNALLKVLDPELWQFLEEHNVDPRFYSFRWITLLLSQDFELPDLLRLWDSLFADPVRFIGVEEATYESSNDEESNERDSMINNQSTNSLMTPPSLTPTSSTISNSTTSNPSSPNQSKPSQQYSGNTNSSGNYTTMDKAAAEKARVMAELIPNDPNYRFELYVCCAMLVHLRDELIGSDDFTECLYKIHHYPEDKREIDCIIVLASKLRQQHLYTQYLKSRPPQSKASRISNSLGNFIDRVTTSSDNNSNNNNNNNHNNNNNSNTSGNNHDSTKDNTKKPKSINSAPPPPPPPTHNSNHTQTPTPTAARQTSKVDSFLAWLKE